MNGGLSGTIAVTGVNATDNPAPGVPVARSLRDAPGFCGRIIGLGYDPLDSGFYASGLLDGGAILPYPSVGRDALRHALLSIRDQFGINALLPNLDSELRAVITMADELREAGIGTCLPDLNALERVSKAQLPRLSAAVDDIVRRQAKTGIDVVNDGEYGKAMRSSMDFGAWWSYVYPRLSGYERRSQPVDATLYLKGEMECGDGSQVS